MANVAVWADIPVTDLERARKFYEHPLGTPVLAMPNMEEFPILRSPQDSEGMDVSTDLAAGQMTPNVDHGVTIYLNANGDMDGMLARVVEAGGEVLIQKQLMQNFGWMAFFRDSEGNRIGLHQAGLTRRTAGRQTGARSRSNGKSREAMKHEGAGSPAPSFAFSTSD
jgi:predicted enzyme related to lactoylglutathione lyase